MKRIPSLILLLVIAGLALCVWLIRSAQSTTAPVEVATSGMPESANKDLQFEELYRDLRYEHPGDGVYWGNEEASERMVEGHKQLVGSAEPEHQSRAYLFLAQQAIRAGDYEKALEYYSALYHMEGISAEERMEAGIGRIHMLKKLGRDADAAKAFAGLRSKFLDDDFQTDPENPLREEDRRRRLADMAMDLDDLDLAREILNPVIGPDTVERQGMGLALAKRFKDAGEYGKAIDVLRRSLGDPDGTLDQPKGAYQGRPAELYRELVDLLYKADNPAGALAAAEEALARLNPELNPDLAFDLLGVIKNYDLGEWYDQLLVLENSADPALRSEAMVRLADYAMLRRDWSEASDIWGTLLAEGVRPVGEQPSDYLRAYESLLRAGTDVSPMRQEALAFLQGAATVDPSLGIRFGDTFEFLEEFEDAELAYRRAAEIGLDSKDGRYAATQLAEVLLAQEKYDEAAQIYHDLVQWHETDESWREYAHSMVGLQESLSNINGSGGVGDMDESIRAAMQNINSIKRTINLAQWLARDGYGAWSNEALGMAQQRFLDGRDFMDSATRLEQGEEVLRALGNINEHQAVLDIARAELIANPMDPAYLSEDELQSWFSVQYNLARSEIRTGEAVSGTERLNNMVATMEDRRYRDSVLLTNMGALQHGRNRDYAQLLFEAAVETGENNHHVQTSRAYLGAADIREGDLDSAMSHAEMMVAFSNPRAVRAWEQKTNRSGHFLTGLVERERGDAGGQVLMDELLAEGSVWSTLRWATSRPVN